MIENFTDEQIHSLTIQQLIVYFVDNHGDKKVNQLGPILHQFVELVSLITKLQTNTEYGTLVKQLEESIREIVCLGKQT